MARYKEEYNGVLFDIQVNIETGRIRIGTEGIEGTVLVNRETGIAGKGEITFTTPERIEAVSTLLIGLFRKVAGEQFGDRTA